MPVSPQDFALWSDLTGNPYPRTPAERMALAPTVYDFNRNLGRSGGINMNPLQRALDVVGKTALAAGALAGAAYIGHKYSGNLEVDNEPGLMEVTPDPWGEPTSPSPLTQGSQTRSKTSDHFNQALNTNQTELTQALAGKSPTEPTANVLEQEPINQSEAISSSQHFSPGNEIEQLNAAAVPETRVRDRADELISEYMGNVDLEQRQKTRIGKSVDEYQAGVAGKGERVLKEVLKEGLKEGITPIGSSRAEAVEAFRRGKVNELITGQNVEPESNVGAEAAEPAAVFVDVEPSPQMRVSSTVTPIAVMSQPSGTTQASAGMGPSSKEIMEVDANLAKALTNKSQEERVGIRNQLLAKKYGTSAAEAEPSIVTAPTGPVRVAREGRITPNEFLSVMSQQEGPLASYSIDPSRGRVVPKLAFYPGGEIEVTQHTKGGPVDYAYATADPYRLAVSDYAEEGFPAGMGSIGGVVAARNLGHQMGLQKSVESGGTIRQKRQPLYAGLMSDADIMAAGMDKSRTVKAKQTAEQAERHFETKNVMGNIENKYPQPAMSPEEKSKLREERQIRSLAPPVNRTGGFAGSPEATDFLRAAKQALIAR